MPWNPELPNQYVRVIDDPGRCGLTTGRVLRLGTILFVQVRFGPNDVQRYPYETLELCLINQEIGDILESGRFGSPSDIRRLLTYEKVKGTLTNIFYSMEVSKTDFYPHQFKPVLKFIESPVGRLLIADEVGLGKTIEALLIWKELQARSGARRLLVVCLAMLREKWQKEMRDKFNMHGEIVNAAELMGHIETWHTQGDSHSFTCIASLEGLRCKNTYEDPDESGPRVDLARLLDSVASGGEGPFDLVIIDESHYLRNASTASNVLGGLLRDASKHLILLTATPIQIHSKNLYQLLRLVSPEAFFTEYIFEELLKANGPIVAALRALWKLPPDTATARESIHAALGNRYFSENMVLHHVSQQLDRVSFEQPLDPEVKIRLCQKIESCSLTGQYMTRTRKREVIERRVRRAPQILLVNYSAVERELYDRVSRTIRKKSHGKRGVSLFALYSRKRQMASCMVAALESWREQGIFNELVEESLYEDFGITKEMIETDNGAELLDDLDERHEIWQEFSGLDIDVIERGDTKYAMLKDFLKNELTNDKKEKFVLFSFFRGTLHYLRRRLEADGIRNCLILGGMGSTKEQILEDFGAITGPNVLLTSEVCSEGVDLQFCRFLINYDLPWNPMKVEQRIGRLDRLGQKAEQISIINFSLIDTIEQKILFRLFDRIKIFEETIGDLEEILGVMTEQLIYQLLQPDLADDQRLAQALQTVDATIAKKEAQEQLEQNAINLFAFSDFLQNSITQSRDQGRWLSTQDMFSFVDDFFALNYAGTFIEPRQGNPGIYAIRLSDAARIALLHYTTNHLSPTTTQLGRSIVPVSCYFDPKLVKSAYNLIELLDTTHPLIRFIKHTYEISDKSFHPVSALRINKSCVPVNVFPGIYVYVVHYWEMRGLRQDNRLIFRVVNLQDHQSLSDVNAEILLTTASREGEDVPNVVNQLEMNQVKRIFDSEMEFLILSFDIASKEFKEENQNRCNVQERSASDYAQRQIARFEQQIANLRTEGKHRIIPAIQGKINKAKDDLQLKLRTISEHRRVKDGFRELAAGILIVEG